MSREERASKVSSDVGCGIAVGAGEAEDFLFRADDRVAGDIVGRSFKYSVCEESMMWFLIDYAVRKPFLIERNPLEYDKVG